MSTPRPKRSNRIGTRPITQAVLTFLERAERELVRDLEAAKLEVSVIAEWSQDEEALYEAVIAWAKEHGTIYCITSGRAVRKLRAAMTTEDQARWRDAAFESPISVLVFKCASLESPVTCSVPFRVRYNYGFYSSRFKTLHRRTGTVRYRSRDFQTIGEAVISGIELHHCGYYTLEEDSEL